MSERHADVDYIKLSPHHSVSVSVSYPTWKKASGNCYTLRVSLGETKELDGHVYIITPLMDTEHPIQYRTLEEASRFSRHKLLKWVKQLKEDKSYMDLVDVFRPYAAQYAAEQAKKEGVIS